MKRSDFYYDLPEELIAQTPVEPRDHSRLLVYDGEISHYRFYDLPRFLKRGDVLVVNETRVIPARLMGRKTTGGAVECLLLKRLDYSTWEAIVKPGKRLQVGATVIFSDRLSAVVKERKPDGNRILEFIFDGVFEDILSELGNTPLPPYIKKKLDDPERYQTVYSKVSGSAAAPTAGLHFTPELLDRIRDMGVQIVKVLLHVGLGTFRPVKEDEIEEHKMHFEYFELHEDAAAVINAAKAENRRVIAVGTTSVRVLESAASEGGVRPVSGETNIFIYPGYKFKVVDALITNFHLPESTLIMLVAALIGREETLRIYNTAVREKYRFFSFGDAMFIEGGIKDDEKDRNDHSNTGAIR